MLPAWVEEGKALLWGPLGYLAMRAIDRLICGMGSIGELLQAGSTKPGLLFLQQCESERSSTLQRGKSLGHDLGMIFPNSHHQYVNPIAQALPPNSQSHLDTVVPGTAEI